MAQDDGTIITRKTGPNQVIHIRSDSEGLMDALFQPANIKSARPLRNRNLPESFFKPSGGNAKRVDSPSIMTDAQPAPSHVRSRSLPTSIQPSTLSIAPQCSSPTVMGIASSPRPPAMHPEPSMSASHSRHKSVPASHNQLFNQAMVGSMCRVGHLADGSIIFQNISTLEVYPDSDAVRDQILGPLPKHWQAQRDQRGELYYVDHNSHSTTWFDPRLPIKVQEKYIQSRNQQPSASGAQFSTGSSMLNQLSGRIMMPHESMVNQQQPMGSNMGGMQGIPQQVPFNRNLGFMPNQFGNQSQPMGPQSAAVPIQHPLPQQQMSRVQELEHEREMMKLRQKELQSQLLFKQQSVYNDPLSTMGSLPSPVNMNDQLMRRQTDYEMISSPVSPATSTNARMNDPFMGTRFHGRYQSDDSGVAISTPHTPENFLSQNMEELSLYQNEAWDANNMDISDGVLEQAAITTNITQDPLLDAPNEINDYLLNEIESVIMGDSNNANGHITWL